MMRCLMMLVGFGLVTPFGAFETAAPVASEIRPSVASCDLEKSTAATETEAEDSELYLFAGSFFTNLGQFDYRLSLLRGSETPTGKVDPLGRRPPPAAPC